MKTKSVEIIPPGRYISASTKEGQKLKLAKDINSTDNFMTIYVQD
jgi:hypothetical protein